MTDGWNGYWLKGNKHVNTGTCTGKLVQSQYCPKITALVSNFLLKFQQYQFIICDARHKFFIKESSMHEHFTEKVEKLHKW